MEIIGWVGSFLLTFCGVPLALQSYRDKHSHGVNMVFLQMWLWGEVLVLAFVLAQPILLWPLIANYAFNTFLILIIQHYKLSPRKISDEIYVR